MIEKMIFYWLMLTLIFAIAIGGKPWLLPGHGQYWIDSLKRFKRIP